MDWAVVGGEGSAEGRCRGEVQGWKVIEGRERERWMGEEGVGRGWREKWIGSTCLRKAEELKVHALHAPA